LLPGNVSPVMVCDFTELSCEAQPCRKNSLCGFEK
jgi:hypothetical protein